MAKPKTYAEIRAFLLDGGRTRKALRNAPDAALYVGDDDPEADEYYVLTANGLDEIEPYLALTRRDRCAIKAQHHCERAAGQSEDSPNG